MTDPVSVQVAAYAVGSRRRYPFPARQLDGRPLIRAYNRRALDENRLMATVASRERLLKEGLAIARRSGLRAITVRGVAARARVNLGSFVYHFGSREAFVGELLERWYAPLMTEMQIAVDVQQPPLQRLREILLQVVGWVPNQKRVNGQGGV